MDVTKKIIKPIIVLTLLFVVYGTMHGQVRRVHVKIGEATVIRPIDMAVVKKAIELVNAVYASQDFRDELDKYNFICSNKPSLCDRSLVIPGSVVYADFTKFDTLTINLVVKRVGLKFWKRYLTGTLGETDPQGTTILTYTWWLDDEDVRELTIGYATHIGHEIFHTKYYQYLHDPAYGSKDFDGEKDVTYKVDSIMEALIRKNYH